MTRRQSFVVLSNALDGRADELRAWCHAVHLPDARLIPGVIAADPYEATPVKGIAPGSHAFMAVYELDGDPAAVWAEFERRVANGLMAMTDAMDASGVSFTMWAPCAVVEPA